MEHLVGLDLAVRYDRNAPSVTVFDGEIVVHAQAWDEPRINSAALHELALGYYSVDRVVARGRSQTVEVDSEVTEQLLFPPLFAEPELGACLGRHAAPVVQACLDPGEHGVLHGVSTGDVGVG